MRDNVMVLTVDHHSGFAGFGHLATGGGADVVSGVADRDVVQDERAGELQRVPQLLLMEACL